MPGHLNVLIEPHAMPTSPGAIWKRMKRCGGCLLRPGVRLIFFDKQSLETRMAEPLG